MKLKNVEDIYPLSSVQQGILFHILSAPQSAMYVNAMAYKIERDIDIFSFKRAWQTVIERHAALRSSFYWKELSKPLQVVHQSVPLPWQQLDWQNVPAIELSSRIKTFLQDSSLQDFDLSQAPLLRLTLIQCSEVLFYFVFQSSHAVLDGWSFSNVLSEVSQLYDSFLHGQRISLRKPGFYRNFIAWLQQQDTQQAKAFWTQRLRGIHASTPLPFARSRPDAVIAEAGMLTQTDTLEKDLSVELSQSLQQFARQERLTLNTIIQGAWALLLQYYSGENDVVFGSTISGRSIPLEDLEQMVGLFINTLPVRVQVQADMCLIEWLHQLQQHQLEQWPYEYSSLAQIQEWLQIPGGSPLFESILVFENYPLDDTLTNASESFFSESISTVDRTNYPLALAIGVGETLSFQFSYDSTRLHAEAIELLAHHLQTLLEQMVTSPGRRLSAFLPLTAQEKTYVLQTLNATETLYPHECCVQTLFEAQVERTPEAQAVAFGTKYLSYRQLNRQANQLAHYLKKLGVGPEVHVGICLERSLALTVAIMGVMKAGGTYLPLDPSYPSERLAFMLQDAQVPVLLTASEIKPGLPVLSALVVCLDTDDALFAQYSQENPGVQTVPENAVYVIYTSGSTGQPKGVQITHRALVNYTLDISKRFRLQPSDRFLQFAALSFDVMVEELFPTWLSGATVVLCKRQTLASPALLLAALTEGKVTLCELPTAYWHEWVRDLVRTEGHPPAHLRLVIVGGERALSEALQHWQHYHIPLMNVYGLTEVTVTSTTYEPDCAHEWPNLPIGRPIANTQMYLLDAQLRPLPVGVPGNLYIGGDSLARGYLSRPALTAERFIPHPFSMQPGERLYDTGDMARWLPDDTLEFLRRRDDQIKLRGYRIELGEIEASLWHHPDVQDGIVLLHEQTAIGATLVAYVVLAKGATLTADELRHYLALRLPTYMLPSAFVFLDALPFTTNGKIDRSALSASGTPPTTQKKLIVAAETAIEEALVEIWSQILGCQEISVSDNFFALGGHSLLAMQLIARVCSTFPVDVSLHSLFEAPTIKEMATIIEQLLIENLEALSDDEIRNLS